MGVNSILGIPTGGLATYAGLPISSLSSVFGLSPVDGGGSAPIDLPDPQNYFPFEDSDISTTGTGDSFQSSISGYNSSGWYQKSGYSSGEPTYQITTSSATKIEAAWYKGASGWYFAAQALLFSGGLSCVAVQIDGTVYKSPTSSVTQPAFTEIDEFAEFEFPLSITEAKALEYMAALYNSGDGVVWRNDQWLSLTEV